MSLTRFLTIDEAAALLGVSTRTIRRRVKDGSLRKVLLGGRAVRIPASELDRLSGLLPQEETESEPLTAATAKSDDYEAISQ